MAVIPLIANRTEALEVVEGASALTNVRERSTVDDPHARGDPRGGRADSRRGLTVDAEEDERSGLSAA